MTAIISLAVPWVLLAYFLYRALTSRIFLLGIPFLMLMDSSVYFDGMQVFHRPGSFAPYLLMTIWLVVVWALATERVGVSRPQAIATTGFRQVSGSRFMPEEFAVLALLLGVLGHGVAGSVESGDLAGTLGRCMPMLAMVLGCFLVRDVVGRTSRAEVVSFLAALVLANMVATILFIAHQGLHVTLYPGAEYLETFFRGQLITRTFTFAPRFGLVILTIAFVLARPRWSLGWGLVLLVSLVGVWVSYTRSLLIVTGVTVALLIVLRELKHPSANRLLRRVLLVGGTSVVIALVIYTVLPVQSEYFEERLTRTRGLQGVTTDASYVARTSRIQSTVEAVRSSGDLAFGRGFPTVAEDPYLVNIDRWGADLAWLLVVYHLGVAGIVTFAALFIGYGVRAFSLYFRNDGDGEYLAMVYSTAIVASLALTLVSRTFMEPSVLPMALWLFAFVAAEARRLPVASSDTAEVKLAQT